MWTLIIIKKALPKHFLLLLVMLVGTSCKTRQSIEANTTNYQSRAQTALGDGLTYKLNSDSTMVLCQKVTPSANEAHRQNVKYLVINLHADSVIHKAEISNGTVSWYNNTQLKVRNYLGYPAVNNEGLYIFDLLEKKRIKLPVDKE